MTVVNWAGLVLLVGAWVSLMALPNYEDLPPGRSAVVSQCIALMATMAAGALLLLAHQ